MSLSELHRAINKAWTDTELDWLFRQRWDAASQALYTSLNDTEAAPGTPFPYCVYMQGASIVTDRMSGHVDGEKHEIHDVPWTFRIVAQSHGSESAKVIAAALAENILRIYGGYPDPSVAPQELGMSNGRCLLAQYQTDYAARLDDEEFSWTIEYLFRVDLQIAV